MPSTVIRAACVCTFWASLELQVLGCWACCQLAAANCGGFAEGLCSEGPLQGLPSMPAQLQCTSLEEPVLVPVIKNC